MPGWLKLTLGVFFSALLVAAVAIVVLHVLNTPRTPDDLLSRNAFRCLAIGESFRTVAQNRIERKTEQITRIERLLNVKNLEPLDEAKLRSELAILSWEVEDSRFMRDCAEAYYEPGSTQMRKKFGTAPNMPDFTAARRVLDDTGERIAPRMLPHGYASRANLYLATAALDNDEPDHAVERAESYVTESPDGLYTDSLKLVIADARLSQGRVEEALALYREVGQLKIGLDAHYARYRVGAILRANGDVDDGESLLDDVRKWAERGDRQALGHFLDGKTPVPPRPAN